MIELVFFDREQHESVFEYELEEKQRCFTVMPIEALNRFRNHSNSYPIIITLFLYPVGFFLLQDGEIVKHYYDTENKMIIRSLSIHPAFQGVGIGKKAMSLLPFFVNLHFSQIKELFLLVHKKNKRAEKLYKKIGFEDRGIRKEGPAGIQKMFHYVLK